MATKQNLSKYSRLKRKVSFLCEDVNFLRSCKKHNVIPNFIKLKCKVENSRSFKAKEKAEKQWLNEEIKFTFKKLSDAELQVYALHLKIANDLCVYEYDEWTVFECDLRQYFSSIVNKKRLKQSKKLRNLIEKQKRVVCIEPEIVPDFVVNQSSIDFSEEPFEQRLEIFTDTECDTAYYCIS